MSDPTGNDRPEVLLALALSQNAAPGECPGPEEIAAWAEGSLSGKRQEDVQAHVAHCDACFAVWSGLIDVGEVLHGDAAPSRIPASRSRPAWRPGWRAWLGGGLGIGVAALLALAVVLPTLERGGLEDELSSSYARLANSYAGGDLPEDWPWATDLSVRSGAGTGATTSDLIARSAFRSGVADGLRQLTEPSVFWRQAIESASRVDATCGAVAEIDDCAGIAQAATVLGRWAALLHLACVSEARADKDGMAGRLTANFWTDQRRTLERLNGLLAERVPTAPFSRFLGQWTAQPGRDPESSADDRQMLCDRVATLMTIGFATPP